MFGSVCKHTHGRTNRRCQRNYFPLSGKSAPPWWADVRTFKQSLDVRQMFHRSKIVHAYHCGPKSGPCRFANCRRHRKREIFLVSCRLLVTNKPKENNNNNNTNTTNIYKLIGPATSIAIDIHLYRFVITNRPMSPVNFNRREGTKRSRNVRKNK